MIQENIKYTQQAGVFKFNRLNCLRNEYFHNDCKECINICSHEAFEFIRNKLYINELKCTFCGSCLGVCPSEALSLCDFEPNEFIQNFSKKDEKLLSCNINIPCLNSFDIHHFIYLGVFKNSCDFDISSCKECEHNKNGKVLENIEKNISIAKEFLKELEKEPTFELKTDVKIKAKREIIKQFVNKVIDKDGENVKDNLKTHESKSTPLKLKLLKSALKTLLDVHEGIKIANPYNFYSNKSIVFEKCTNCAECIQFCPTGALSHSGDKLSIFFQIGKCINCNICSDICKPKAFEDINGFDILEFAYDKARVLIKHEIAVCTECKAPFSYKGGKKICDRCIDFTQNYDHFFKTAAELEG
ncbi:MAG: 4Fe-4S binding protein [Campylobacterales bacterium]|nr:4Fe-4S binding protein [Campylobacterales bacterium]